MKNANFVAALATTVFFFIYENPSKYPYYPVNDDFCPEYFQLFSAEEHVLGHITGGTSFVANTHTFTNPQNPEESMQVEEIQYSLADPDLSFTAYYNPGYSDISNHVNTRMILDHFYVEGNDPGNYTLQLEAHVIALPDDWIANQYIDKQKETYYTGTMSVQNGSSVHNVHNIKVMDGVERFKSSTYWYLNGPYQLTAQKGPTAYTLNMDEPIYYRIPDAVTSSGDMRFVLIQNVKVLENGNIRTIDYLLNPISRDNY
ncbi:MAG: hypothetical protein KDC28_05780 [Saprospiraceae bacterium]|nr:hypothetical protein [Saprospiraceae bacterium]MCB9322007.1 hypothetical protein [Lewinellaceae bacterium]